MERKFNLTVSLISGERENFPISITNDNESVYKAFCETCEDIRDFHGDFETFTLYNVFDEVIFTEEIYDTLNGNDELRFCRWCGKPFEQDEDMYVEDSCNMEDYYHCSDCHNVLYTDEEWQKLYEEYNLDGDDEDNGGDSYYYTTAP